MINKRTKKTFWLSALIVIISVIISVFVVVIFHSNASETYYVKCFYGGCYPNEQIHGNCKILIKEFDNYNQCNDFEASVENVMKNKNLYMFIIDK